LCMEPKYILKNQKFLSKMGFLQGMVLLIVVNKDKSWKISGEYYSTDKRMESHLKFFIEYFKGFGMKTPLMSQG